MLLTPEQVGAVNVILSGVQLAQKRGAFSLKEAHTLQEALDKLAPHAAQEGEAEQGPGDEPHGDQLNFEENKE
jgi:hypothetical protein